MRVEASDLMIPRNAKHEKQCGTPPSIELWGRMSDILMRELLLLFVFFHALLKRSLVQKSPPPPNLLFQKTCACHPDGNYRRMGHRHTTNTGAVLY